MVTVQFSTSKKSQIPTDMLMNSALKENQSTCMHIVHARMVFVDEKKRNYENVGAESFSLSQAFSGMK